MNRAVEDQSGLFMTALATWPMKLSPAVMEKPLCSLSCAYPAPGVTTANAGRFPPAASVRNWPVGAMPDAWVQRHSAKYGQMAQSYPPPCAFTVFWQVSRPLAALV